MRWTGEVPFLDVQEGKNFIEEIVPQVNPNHPCTQIEIHFCNRIALKGNTFAIWIGGDTYKCTKRPEGQRFVFRSKSDAKGPA